jgi:hypothetical protein
MFHVKHHICHFNTKKIKGRYGNSGGFPQLDSLASKPLTQLPTVVSVPVVRFFFISSSRAV